MSFKRGTPGFGIFIGAVLVALGALVMLIGFWKTLVLGALFGIGYFLGTVTISYSAGIDKVRRSA